MSTANTPKLDLLRIQDTWQFGDEAFNRFIDDADDKLVGVAHLDDKAHWSTWKKDTAYVKNDVVRIQNNKSHQYYQCITAGTSGTTEPTNNVTGSVVTDGTVTWMVMSLSEATSNGGVIQIWLSGNYYHRGDAVIYGTALYRCKVDHTSSDWDTDYDYWQEVFASIRLWKPIIYYFEHDTVIVDNSIYKCIVAHKSGTVFDSTEEANWEMIGGAGSVKDWVTATKYEVGQLVVKDGILYRCNTKHTSTTFATDIANWELVNAQIKNWATGEYYVAGTLVAYNNIIYKCTTTHTSSATFEADIANWTLYHNIITTWATSKAYFAGQIVIYSGTENDFRLYRCNTTHVSDTFANDIAKWDVIDSSLALWKSATIYKVGDIVLYNNQPFRCILNHTSDNSSIFEDITDSVATNCWDYIGNKNPFVFPWDSSVTYSVNQLVTYNGTLYKCNELHTSGVSFDPTKFDLVYANIQSWATGISYKQNSMVINDGSLYLCITAHTSTTFNNDSANWLQIGGEGGVVLWTPSTAYANNTVVVNDNVLYISNATHTSGATFSGDIAYWDLVYASLAPWEVSTYYSVGSVVIRDNMTYKCVTAHTSDSTSFSVDGANWVLLDNTVRPWVLNEYYYAGQLVIYNNVLYRCTTGNIATVDFDSVKNNFTLVLSNLQVWQTGMVYHVGSIVLYDGVIYRCNTEHTSASPFDVTKWDLVYANIRQYADNTVYKVGSEVIYDKKLYRCIQSHTSSDGFDMVKISSVSGDLFTAYNRDIPVDYVLDLGNSYDIAKVVLDQLGSFAAISLMDVYGSIDNVTFKKIGIYSNPSASSTGGTISVETVPMSVQYLKFVVRGENTFYDPLSRAPFVTLGDLEVYGNGNYWELIGSFDTFILNWQSGKKYKENEVVLHNDTLYRCNTPHLSSAFSDDTDKWDYLNSTKTWGENTYYPLHTLVVYNSKLYRCTTAHTSTATFALDNWELLSGGSGGLEYWKPNYDYNYNDLFVAENKIYRVLNGYTSGNTFENPTVLREINVKTWTEGESYSVDDIILEGAVYYKVVNDFVAGATFDTTNLSQITISEWEDNTEYTTVGQYLYGKGAVLPSDRYVIGDKAYDTYTESGGTAVYTFKGLYGDPNIQVRETESTSETGTTYTYERQVGNSWVKMTGKDETAAKDLIRNGVTEVVMSDYSAYSKANPFCIGASTNFTFTNSDGSDTYTFTNNSPSNPSTTTYTYNGQTILHDLSNLIEPVGEYPDTIYKVVYPFTSGEEFSTVALVVIGGGSSGSVTIEDWQPSTAYSTGDLFIYRSSIWQVVNDFISGSTFDDTNCVALTGATATSSQIQALFI